MTDEEAIQSCVQNPLDLLLKDCTVNFPFQ
jgi:hypothetical protein